MKRVTIAVALILTAAPAEASEPFPRYGNDLDCRHCAPMEFDRLAAMLGDEALRDLMCRLSSQRFTPGRLSSALGMPEGQVLRRVKTLQGWGLVRMVRYDSATTIVEPLPGDGARTLRRWAVKYCPLGDECGRPAGDADRDDVYANRDDVYEVRVASKEALSAGNNLVFNPDYSSARERMVAEIEDDMLATSVFTGRQTMSDGVRNAISKTPRHEFVLPELRHRAYENQALPIAGGQRMPPPFIVALMTEVLDLEPNEVVLEIGTGSGYQTAILSRLVSRVHSIEIVEILYIEATERLKRLGFLNVEPRAADGFRGWTEKGLFDAIIVTTAMDRIPETLLRQLVPGGRMVGVVNGTADLKQIVLVKKAMDGSISKRNLLSVRHVPLTGKI